MLPSDMNLQIGKIENYNNKILVSSSNFNIGTNLKINLGDDKHIEKGTCKSDVKSRKEENDDDKHIEKDKPDIKPKKEHKQNIKMIKTNLT